MACMAAMAPSMSPMFLGAPMQGTPEQGLIFSPTPMGFMPMAMGHPMSMVPMMEMRCSESSKMPAPSKLNSRAKPSNAKLQRSTPKGRQEQRSSKPERTKTQGNLRTAGGSSRPQGEADEDAANADKGVISLLQEFIQCSKQFPSPQHRPILQWSFDTHMADFTNLEFRAQVGFLLDGVAHHVAGSWQASKKMAQRDTAERCLGFFVGTWGAYLLNQSEEPKDKKDGSASIGPSASPQELVDYLETFCQSLAACDEECPSWSVEWEESLCYATVDLHMLGVRHTFRGVGCTSEEDAKADTAKRVLWYLQCPGFELLYEADPQSAATVAKEMPAPAACWVASLQNGESVQAAERKTTLMRVQNRLQQVFARQLKPGQGVWEWSYETDADDTAWPPLCRTKVLIPAAKQAFEGPWVRGQREAQIETCNLVTNFLNSSSGSPITGSSPMSSSTIASTDASGADSEKVEMLGALAPGKVKTVAGCKSVEHRQLVKGGC